MMTGDGRRRSENPHQGFSRQAYPRPEGSQPEQRFTITAPQERLAITTGPKKDKQPWPPRKGSNAAGKQRAYQAEIEDGENEDDVKGAEPTGYEEVEPDTNDSESPTMRHLLAL